MGKKARNPSRAKNVVLRELKREKRASKTHAFLLFTALLSTITLVLLVTSHYVFTGYSTYLSSQAGYITEANFTRLWATPYWNGIYGLAIRVPDFTEQQFDDFNNEIARKDLFFDCIDLSAEGGNEVYASNVTTVDFDTLVAATPAEVDAIIGCSGKTDCATGTFIKNISVRVGTNNITDVPATHTYRHDSQNNIFDIGILKDGSGNFVYVAHIDSIQKGYSPNVTVNFQMLLPHTTSPQRYYFFTDPNDECPGGGVGNTVNALVNGTVRDEFGNVLEDVTIIFTGNTTLTNASGEYTINSTVSPGTYSVIAKKDGYNLNFTNVTVSFGTFVFERNLTLFLENTGKNETYIPHVTGYITDTSNVALADATVLLGGISATTDSNGFYSMYPTVIAGNNTVVAYKSGYNNNYTIVNLSGQPSDVSVNITLKAVTEDLPFATGPYSKKTITEIIEEAKRNGEDFWISTKEVIKEVRKNTFIEDVIGIYNFQGTMNLAFALDPALDDIVTIDKNSLQIPSNSFGEVGLTLYGTEPVGIYSGNLTISGSISRQIPITVKIVERRIPIEALLMNVDLFKKRFNKGENMKYKVLLQNLLTDQGYRVEIISRVRGTNGSQVYAEARTEEEISTSLTLLEELQLPEEIPNGDYRLDVEARYIDSVSRISVPFRVSQPIYLYSFFGIPLWIYLATVSFLSFVLLNLLLYKKHLDKKKRYRILLDNDTLPKPGKRVVNLGHIAETKRNAYFEIDKLTTHAVVAGATGMGKSISAQVIIEEALKQNINVLVFDPTAQWSGMLRKLEDKKMFSFYSKFGMKTSDARGFPGNIRAIKDARQIVEVQKYFEPGHIQIFTVNKLQPKDMDIFVANTIREIFKSDPKESPNLKMILVFDEVHRLLPKFGGSGEGFLQIERACREFRKWGIGMLLISQVMNDFVGEIKANINTEVQTRTVEEGDLERIKSKYGQSYLSSLVKSEVGVAMFQNADYNLGRPYFINFRPILHNTRRLSDEELEKYNQYNDSVDDLEYQIEQLEELKVDVFDLKMELKLVKDKIMTGNFSVVDIYLEGLKPRITKQWEKLGKKPKKKEIKLASLEEIKASVAEAKKESEKAQKEEDKKEGEENKSTDAAADLENKQFEPLTFDNGMMVSSIGELKDALPSLDDEMFKTHVNEEKNDVATWFENVDKAYAAKLKTVTNKEELLKMITEYKPGAGGDKKPEEKKAEKKPVEKTVEKKEEKQAEEKLAGEKIEKEEEPKSEEKPVEKKGEVPKKEKEPEVKVEQKKEAPAKGEKEVAKEKKTAPINKKPKKESEPKEEKEGPKEDVETKG